MEFKQLDIKPQGSWIKRTLLASHTRKTVLYIALGASASFLFFYLTEGRQMATMPGNDIIKSLFMGGFLGFFITNSPCARNKC